MLLKQPPCEIGSVPFPSYQVLPSSGTKRTTQSLEPYSSKVTAAYKAKHGNRQLGF